MSEILGTLFKYLVSLLGVAAVVLVLYQVFGANKTQNAIADITLLQTNTQGLYNGQNSFNGATPLSNAVAIAGKLAPSDMIPGAAGVLSNPWGGTVTIAPNANPALFDITENTLVPADACAKMAVSVGSVVSLKIGAGAVLTPPLDAGSVAIACNTASNPMVFTFGH